jgi:hypothetical protein
LRVLSARDNNEDAKRMDEGGVCSRAKDLCCDFNQESVHPPSTAYTQADSRSNIYVELSAIWIVRSQTDMAVRDEGGCLYSCVHLSPRSVNKAKLWTAVAMLPPNFLDQSLKGFGFYLGHNRRLV